MSVLNPSSLTEQIECWGILSVAEIGEFRDVYDSQCGIMRNQYCVRERTPRELFFRIIECFAKLGEVEKVAQDIATAKKYWPEMVDPVLAWTEGRIKDIPYDAFSSQKRDVCR